MKQKYYYSQSTKGFYNSSIHGFEKPSDCVELTEGEYQELLYKSDNMDIVINSGKAVLKEKILTSSDLKDMIISKLKQNLNLLGEKLSYNETYIGTEEYDSYKRDILSEIKDKRILINELDSKSFEDLKVLFEELKS